MNQTEDGKRSWLSALAAGAVALSAQTAVADDYVLIAESDSRCKLYIDGVDLIAEGCNVHIRDGSGSTVCTQGNCNGTGNLVVGYDQNPTSPNPDGLDKSGSHNIVVGDGHAYRSWGGLVAGYRNRIEGPYSSVSGGQENQALRLASSVSGGSYNEVMADRASISGGYNNYVGAQNGHVSGGSSNEVSGQRAAICGGQNNIASGNNSTVSGGRNVTASGTSSTGAGGYYSEASGSYSTVAGGYVSAAEGSYSVVAGGAFGTAEGQADSVFGGNYGRASGGASTVLGGSSNDATGVRSTVCGGNNRLANGTDDTALGGVKAQRVNLPRTDGSNTRIPANSTLGPFTVDFGMTMPCSPIVMAQVYNSGAGQTAPFLVSIEEASSESFVYHLINPSNREQRAYTGSLQYTALCR